MPSVRERRGVMAKRGPKPKKTPAKTCEVCGVVFVRPVGVTRVVEWNKRRFCSNVCRHASWKFRTHCKNEHPLEANRKVRADTGWAECLACIRARGRKRDSRTYRASQGRLRKRRIAEVKARVWDLKRAPCSDCGQSFHPQCMDFDHRDAETKTRNVSALVSTGSWPRVSREIAKCDLVCSNCHRLRTMHRRAPGRVTAGRPGP